MAIWNVACLSHCYHYYQNASPTASLCYCLVSITAQQASINLYESNCFFFLYGRIQGHIFVSYALAYQMPFCQTSLPSAAICVSATKCNGILVGRFSLCFHTPPTSTSVVIGGITFGATLIYMLLTSNFQISYSVW